MEEETSSRNCPPLHKVNLSFTSTIYLWNRHVLPLPPHPTIVIMTHLPVKLLPVETAGLWRGTQSLSASNFNSLKSQVDIILTATALTPPPNASIFS